MARLSSIRGGTLGRPGDMTRGIAPQPPIPPRPPKVPKMLSPSGQVRGQMKTRQTRTRDNQDDLDKPRSSDGRNRQPCPE
jgi:hypothetical protein